MGVYFLHITKNFMTRPSSVLIQVISDQKTNLSVFFCFCKLSRWSFNLMHFASWLQMADTCSDSGKRELLADFFSFLKKNKFSLEPLWQTAT